MFLHFMGIMNWEWDGGEAGTPPDSRCRADEAGAPVYNDQPFLFLSVAVVVSWD